MENLISYKGDKKLKSAFLKEIEKHEKADDFIKGTYSKTIGGKFKGCAVGCSIESLNKILDKTYSNSDHKVYETTLGIPEWLARLEDTIFEGLPVEESKKWPRQFAKAIPVGVDLNPVKWKMSAFVLKENIERVLTLKEISDELKKQVVDSIRGVLSVTETAIQTGTWNESAARSAWSAWSAARSAQSAAESAAESAAQSAWSARSAAQSAWSARSAARSAWSAAWSAWSAAESAWSAAYTRYATHLLELLKNCNGEEID